MSVFLGRLNSFIADSNLGAGENAGEKATLATQTVAANGKIPVYEKWRDRLSFGKGWYEPPYEHKRAALVCH